MNKAFSEISMTAFLAILALIAMIALPPCTFAGDGHSVPMPKELWTNDDAVFTVVTDYWPPFRINTKTGRLTGIDRDLMDEIGKRMGVSFTWHRRPWVRCLLEIEHGLADVMTGVAKTPERAKYIHYSDTAYMTLSPAFYVHKDTGADAITHYEDLKKFSIGYTRGSAYFKRFDNDDTLNKKPGNDEEMLIEMVREKRWDTLIGTDAQVEYDLSLRELRGTIVKAAYKPDSAIKLYLGISKRSPLMNRMEELNRVLERILSDGTFQKICEKYLGK